MAAVFSEAVTAVIDGDAATLRSLLTADPTLATAIGPATLTPDDGNGSADAGVAQVSSHRTSH